MTRKRTDDLLVDAIGWLSNDDDVQSRIGESGDVIQYGEVDNPGSMPPVAIAVTVLPGNTTRNNKQEDKTHIVEVEVSASNTWVDSHTPLELSRLLGDVDDVLTVHRDGWGADGQSGGTDGISLDESRPRYSGVRRYDFSRNDPAAPYDND